MVKKILLTFLLLSAVGCSFSKKSAEERAQEAIAAKTRALVDDVIGDQRYTLRTKLENAIARRDKQLFSELLKSTSLNELNREQEGKSLGELAIDTRDLFFLKGLLDAGMSPFIGTDTFADGLFAYARYKDNVEALRFLFQVKSEILRQASKVCVVSDFKILSQFLDRNLISPIYNVCGTMNLFGYYFSYVQSDNDTVDQVLIKYVDPARRDYGQIGQEILYAAFVSNSPNLWKKVVDLVALKELKLFGRGFEDHINYGNIESALNGYIFVRDISPEELLKNIRYYVRARIKFSDRSELDLVKSLLDKAGLDSPVGIQDDLPFKDHDCEMAPIRPSSLPANDENPPLPGEGSDITKEESMGPRSCP
ncbi:MAG: hypothetical protein ACM3MG_01625 [Bacillota bacterium]